MFPLHFLADGTAEQGDGLHPHHNPGIMVTLLLDPPYQFLLDKITLSLHFYLIESAFLSNKNAGLLDKTGLSNRNARFY